MAAQSESLSSRALLLELDESWWTRQRPRRMDVIGDYAGQELFCVDGDALIQHILANPLLALGKENDLSFQFIHALWLLERTISQLIERDGVFDVVFFESNLHITIEPGGSDHVVASRHLIRTLLQNHLKQISGHFNVLIFEDPRHDPAWIKYRNKKRPMFFMTDDGGVAEGRMNKLDFHRILLQRLFVREVMTQDIAIVQLTSAEFRDGKLVSFVYDRSSRLKYDKLDPGTELTAQNARGDLQAKSSLKTRLHSGDLQPCSNFIDTIISVFRCVIARSQADPEQSGLSTKILLFIFLCHLMSLPSLEITTRAQSYAKISGPLHRYLRDCFLPTLYTAFNSILTHSTTNLSTILSEFDLDGRVFLCLLSFLQSGPEVNKMTFESFLGSAIYSNVVDIWTGRLGQHPITAEQLVQTFPPDSSREEPLQTPAQSADRANPHPAALLPCENPTFTKFMARVAVDTSLPSPDAELSDSKFAFNTVFSDVSHWHVNRPLLPDHLSGDKLNFVTKMRAPTAREKFLRDRREQRYMASFQKDAASLTGAMGAALQQQAIPVVGRRLSKDCGSISRSSKAPLKVSHNPARGNAQKEGKKKLTSTEKLKSEIQSSQAAVQARASHAWWSERLESLKGLSTLEQIPIVDGFLRSKRAHEAWVGAEVRLKRLDLEIRKWIDESNTEDQAVHDSYRVTIATEAKSLLDGHVKKTLELNDAQIGKLLKALKAIGLFCLAPSALEAVESNTKSERNHDSKELQGGSNKSAKTQGGEKSLAKKGKKDSKPAEVENATDVKLSFSFISLMKGKKLLYEFMDLKEDPIEFQLRCMGPHMERSLDSKQDPRVNFEPDGWQIDVLDKIERDESILVVAPTSSGKTFISFAAMEKVLRESDDGVIIYVAPTKALVYQVAAEVYARFKKDVPGMNLWAIHTRDHRINNPQSCSILVTVPHILSIMLLSPSLAAAWVPRIRRIIFDEIHCISEDEGGAIWEQVLLMNPAPLIGLSATVGDPRRFSGWLENVEKTGGKVYSLVIHQHRYNALRKFAYAPTFPAKPLTTLTHHKIKSDAFLPINPIAALAFGNTNLPEDLALEPRDCLELWKQMKSVSKETLESALAPATFFRDSKAVKIAHVIRYEAVLKAKLLEWIASSDPEDPESNFNTLIRNFEQPLRKSLAPSEEIFIKDPDHAFSDCLVSLVADLNAQNMLPAIFFHFDRSKCEITAEILTKQLEEAEQRWRDTSAVWKKRVAKAEEQERLALIKAKAMERLQKKKKDPDELPDDSVSASAFNPEWPSEEFVLLGKGAHYSELDEAVRDLRWANIPSWAISALKRGIGVHHAGMNRKYRTLVETMFRRGILRVVISTGTLALGINAPAKTTVFLGDSAFLTALNFRQCAGRAGRRGFDLVGNVVFCGVTLDRIERLLLSRLPRLGGSFPLTTTLILRLHNLLHGSMSAPSAVKAVESLLTQPQLSISSSGGPDQVVHFVRFSIEYLRRAGLLDQEGRPKDLYAVASTLYPYEPQNFALVALLRSGVLHQLTENFDEAPLQTTINLLQVLANLFGRVHRKPQSAESLAERAKRSSSMLVLPNLPVNVKAVLMQHHKLIVNVFSSYAKIYSIQYRDSLGVDNHLPLSNRQFGVTSSDGATAHQPTFLSKLEERRLNFDSRSPFVASSGWEDEYIDVEEISNTARKGIHLCSHAVPSLIDHLQPKLRLDSYVVDFFKHGSMKTIVKDHGIRSGDIWFLLQDFDLSLSAIKTALEILLIRAGQDPEPDHQGSKRFSEDTEEDDGSLPDEENVNDDEDDDLGLIPKPRYVSEEDWRLYRAICALKNEFQTKFKAVFA